MTENLDWTRLSLISNTSKQKFFWCTPNNLAIKCSFSILECILCLCDSIFSTFSSCRCDFFNKSVVARSVYDWLKFTLFSENCHRAESVILLFVFPNWHSLLWINRVWVLIIPNLVRIELPIENTCVPTTCHKTSIVFKPANWLYEVIVAFEVKFWGWLTWIKFKYADIRSILTGEILTSMGELDLATIFNLNIFERHKCLVQYVHHAYTFSKTNHHLKTTWMKGKRICFILKGLAKF
jgi:hypothetical protein